MKGKWNPHLQLLFLLALRILEKVLNFVIAICFLTCSHHISASYTQTLLKHEVCTEIHFFSATARRLQLRAALSVARTRISVYVAFDT